MRPKFRFNTLPAKGPPIPFQVSSHVWKSVEELFAKSPIFQIAVIPLEQRRLVPSFQTIVVEECVLEAKWPIETQMMRVVVRQVGCGERSRVCREEAPAEGRPSEEVECNGVGGLRLGAADNRVSSSGLGE
jgi:hypothetical protein